MDNWFAEIPSLFMLSHVWLFATPWIRTHQAPMSMEFSKQEYYCGLPLPPPGDLPNSGIKPASLVSPALAGRFFTNYATCDGWAIGSLKSLSDSRFSWMMMKIRQVKLEELRNIIQLLPSAYYSHIYSFIQYSIHTY